MKAILAAAVLAPLTLATAASAADVQRYEEPDDRGGDAGVDHGFLADHAGGVAGVLVGVGHGGRLYKKR